MQGKTYLAASAEKCSGCFSVLAFLNQVRKKKKKRVKKAVVSSKQIQFSPEKLFAGQWVVSKNAIE